MRDEAMKGVDEPEKAFEPLFGLGALEVPDGGDAVFEWFDAGCRDVVSEEGEAFHAEGAVGGDEEHTVAEESAEDFSQVLDVMLELVINMSSTCTKMMSSPRKMCFKDPWKACALFRKPHSMCRNSKAPKGVVIAVFGMSSAANGI